MKERIKDHIEVLFADAERRSPANQRLAELKEELLQNTLEKYEHLLTLGKSPEAAYASAVDGIGDISALLDDVIEESDTRRAAESAMRSAAAAEVKPETEGADGDGDDGDGDDGDDDDDDDDDADNGEAKRPPRSPWYKLASGIIWTVTLGSYFAISFATHAWAVTWLVFLMGIAADNVAEGIFDLRR
jgi:hypothetical protein